MACERAREEETGLTGQDRQEATLVVALDGGGIRGALQARILERLDAYVPGLLDRAWCLAGTSIGSVNAAWLASGRPVGGLVPLFRDRGREIFQDSALDDLKDLGGLRGAQYGSGGLQSVLQSVFGDLTMGQLPRRALVTAFDLDAQADQSRPRGWRPKFFDREHDAATRVTDALGASTAAPTFFPTWAGYCDGGVVANNPAACALAYAYAAGRRDLWLLSIGTGLNPTWVDGEESLDWGLVQWAPRLVSILIDGAGQVPDFQCRQVLGDRYARVQPVLPREVPLDAADAVDELVAMADKVDLSQVVEWGRRALQ